MTIRTARRGIISAASAASAAAPTKYAAGYYPIWQPMPRLTNVNQNYKNIILFEALPVGGANGSGALQWDTWDDTNGAYTNRIADIATCRARGQKIIMSIGGDGGDMNFTSRTKSQTCIDSIRTLANALGGIDGLDWDNYETVTPVTAEYVWMGQQLKSASYFGPNFIIQTAVGPWKAAELTSFFTAMFNGNALDHVMPMMYADTVYNQDYILNNSTGGIGAWATAIGGYPRLVIGFGIDDADPTNYMTSAEILNTWNAAVAAHPTIGGAACWDIYNDIHQTSGAANSVATGTMAAVLAADGGGNGGGGTGETTITTAYVTGYTWFDNTPPGSSTISDPIIHSVAGGTGTYADPITVAVGWSTGPTVMDYDPGTIMYMPYLRRYFIVEDKCGDTVPPQNGPCHNLATADAGATTWVDIWIGGEGGTETAVQNCANAITGIHTIIIDPVSTYPVVSGPVYNNGCSQMY